MGRSRTRTGRLRERFVDAIAQDPRVDDETFRFLSYLSELADENGIVVIDNEDGTTETLRLRMPKEER